MASVTPASSAAAHSAPGTGLPWAVFVTIRLWSNQGCATAGKLVAHSNCSYSGFNPATCLAPPPLCVTTPPSVLVMLVCVSGTTRLNTILTSRILLFTPFLRISVSDPPYYVYISFSFCLAFSLFFSLFISLRSTLRSIPLWHTFAGLALMACLCRLLAPISNDADHGRRFGVAFLRVILGSCVLLGSTVCNREDPQLAESRRR